MGRQSWSLCCRCVPLINSRGCIVVTLPIYASNYAIASLTRHLIVFPVLHLQSRPHLFTSISHVTTLQRRGGRANQRVRPSVRALHLSHELTTKSLPFKDGRGLYTTCHIREVVSTQYYYWTDLVAPSVMLPVYEFVITFDQEVAAVWTRGKKFTFGSFLLVSTRWCLVFAAVIACLPPKITVRHRLS